MILQAMDSFGVNRVGLADTVGIATPLQVIIDLFITYIFFIIF